MTRLVALLMAAAVLLRANGAVAATYTLPELLALVRNNSPGIRAAREGVEVAKTQVGQARLSAAPFGDFYAKLSPVPTLRNGSYSAGVPDPNAFNGLSTSYVDWLHTGVGDGLAKANPFQGAFVSLFMSVVQPIYTFGKISNATHAAESGVIYARGQALIAAADIELDATRAYWLIKCERAARDVMDDIVVRLDEWVRRFQSDMEGANEGKYSEADLARLKAALEMARLVRFECDRQVAGALATVRALTLDESADVDDAAVAVDDDAGRTLAWYEDFTPVHRPEMKLIEGGLQAERYLRKWRLSDMFPSLVLLTGVGYNQSSNRANALTLGVMPGPNYAYPFPGLGPVITHWDLDLAVRYGRLQEAIEVELAARETARWALSGIRYEVRKAWADHEEARLRAEQLAHAEKVARGWYHVVVANMAMGLTVANDARELVEALRTYFDFRMRHLLAIMDANLTLTQLHRASGVR